MTLRVIVGSESNHFYELIHDDEDYKEVIHNLGIKESVMLVPIDDNVKNIKELNEIHTKAIQSDYINDWCNKYSKKYEEDGHYKWMADFIENYKIILEIGCGVGFSTLELAQRGHKILSIDDNTYCLTETKKILESNNFRVQILNLDSLDIEQFNFNEFDVFLLKINMFQYKNESPVLLPLKKVLKFDAVICWLIGTNRIIKDLTRRCDYRIRIQNNVYELANDLLRKDGILNIIDRVPIRSIDSFQEIKNECIELHIAQAAYPDITTLQIIKNIEHRTYKDIPPGSSDMKMLATKRLASGEIKKIEAVDFNCFFSISSIKK